MESESHWELIRASWVNGNRKDAKEYFNELHPKTQIAVCLEAVTNSYAVKHLSGELVDLIEFLRSYLKA